MNRFGDITEREIDENVIGSITKNTENSKNSVWRQFMSFCAEKKYTFNLETPVFELGFSILYFHSRNILPKYHLCLKINRISIQAFLSTRERGRQITILPTKMSDFHM
jgi:hypothetical protein